MIERRTVELTFAALCCWREARGQTMEVKIGQLWCLRNRVEHDWIGDNTYQDVACHPHQFSGLTQPGDPNLVKFPDSKDPYWLDCLNAADLVMSAPADPDPVQGATFYHDVSIPGPPAAWGPVQKTVQMGRLIFYRPV